MNILIGENIKRLRRSYNITQEQLSNIFNVSTAAVCKWETGETYPDITLIPQIAYYFKVSLDELVGYDESKVEEEIMKIINEYNAIPNQEKYNGKCTLINDSRKKYPHDYRIAEIYMFDLVGGYADNDPSLLIKHSVELLKICDEIKNFCKDFKIRINALTMEAKILNALDKKEEALEIINQFPSFYHSSNQREEQLYDKSSKEYYNVLIKNLKEVGALYGDKLAKVIFYDNTLSKEGKNKKIELIKVLFNNARLDNLEAFTYIEDQFMRRVNKYFI